MTMLPLLPRALLLSLGLLALSGCAATGDRAPAYATPPARAEAPAAGAPLPDLSESLRCMDDLLLDHGARDLTVVAEDLPDPQRKTAASKDLLIGAVSDMSRRSRAIRIVAQGADGSGSLQAAGQYVLRGSVSRPDDRTLAVYLTMMNAQDGSAVPGVLSRRQAAATDDATLRTLARTATIEIFGRLTKVPYWTCLGQKHDDPAVAAEIGDWYDAMATRPREIIEYFQGQLRLRGAYTGPIDGAPSVPFNDAVARYREALGLSREPRLTRDFLQAYLGANHRELKAKVAAAPPAPAPVAAPTPAPVAALSPAPQPVVAALSPATPPAPVLAAPPLAVHVGTDNDAKTFGRDELIRLTVRPTRDAHVYCFLQDENRKISRFFPNRFQRDSRVDAGVGLQLPGAMRFEIRMNGKGAQETVACFATERDVLPELPVTLAASDFTPLPAASLDEVRDAFRRAARGGLAQASLDVRPK